MLLKSEIWLRFSILSEICCSKIIFYIAWTQLFAGVGYYRKTTVATAFISILPPFYRLFQPSLVITALKVNLLPYANHKKTFPLQFVASTEPQALTLASDNLFCNIIAKDS